MARSSCRSLTTCMPGGRNKLLRLRTFFDELPGINKERWEEIVVAFSQRVVAIEVGDA